VTFCRNTSRAAAPFLVALALLAKVSPAADGPSERPLLEQLNRETEALYQDVSRGLLRVQLPPPRWVEEPAAAENPLSKYKELDPKVRRELELRRRKAAGRAGAEGEPLARADWSRAPETRRTASDVDVKLEANAAVIVVPPPAPEPKPQPARDAVLGGRLETTVSPAPAFNPNNVGLLLDDQGHVLVPLYVEREAAAEQPVRFAGADGRVTDARFVGSDRQTNLTVLQLPRPTGTSVRLADDPPRNGSLVMLVTPSDASGRLGLWTGGGRDFAVVFSTDGRCAGIARFGQFLSGRACRLIAEQIIRHGSVKRATLGVIITEVRKDDPLRQQSPLLGQRTAMRIDQVMPGSAAEKAGLQPGDVLLALAGEAVNDIPSLAAAIAARSGRTELQVLREGKVLRVTVDLQQK
jgi:S1-C subfamily serine protease